ncbi:ADAMTS-like protein 4 isoform X2 [Ischnura elegans]|uniref:ADAMTS-like protein 4 isoform X2 n=1 Tax=Ischnura elegans TaxID=197161 RepID=UPI001ED8AC39|nr:ADAMTS-like protein 4 isoform X2 [Ischnura elegans]
MDKIMGRRIAVFCLLWILHVGCDGVIGSDRSVDACGVCGGDNSTCRLVSGLFTRPQLPVGYNLIAQIPSAACHINITELKQSRNYLALRRADGSYIINGNWAINWSGEYEAAGTRFTYRRQDANGGEYIAAKGPLLEPVDIMVIYQQPNPGIKYEYMLPVGDFNRPMGVSPSTGNRPGAPGYYPGAGAGIKPPIASSLYPDDIPAKDGPIFDDLDTRSKESPAGRLGGQQVLPPGDDSKPLSARTRMGGRGSKRKFIWKLSGFGECSKSCGGGVQSNTVHCVREHNHSPVPERRCSPQDRPVPQTAPCNNKPCPAEWVAGDWGPCSVSCGSGGMQTRDVWCQQEISATLRMRVAEGACLSPPSSLPRSRPCPNPPLSCSARTWTAGEWGPCSSQCGKGMRSRVIRCVGSDGAEAAPGAAHCPMDEKPPQEEVCDMGPCTPNTWFVTEWSQQCSEDCGTGVQTRKVHCSAGASPGSTDLSPSEGTCDASSRPEVSRACSSDKQCSGKWFAGKWGQCSAQCGPGRQTRDVICVSFLHGQFRVTIDSDCPLSLKPEPEKPCEQKPCGPEWYTTEWTQCSKPCGMGVQRREVKCVDENQRSSLRCPEETRPVQRRACNTQDCSASVNAPVASPVGSSYGDGRSYQEGKSSSSAVGQTRGSSGVSYRPGPQVVSPSDVGVRLRTKTSSTDNNGQQQGEAPAAAEPSAQSDDESVLGKEDCKDQFRNCNLVVQARLCRYKYYRNACCLSCHNKGSS